MASSDIRGKVPPEVEERLEHAVTTFRENHKNPTNLALHGVGYYAILKGVFRFFRHKRFTGLLSMAVGVVLTLAGHEIEGTPAFASFKSGNGKINQALQVPSGGTAAVLFRSLKGAVFGFIPLIGFYIGQRTGGVVWAVAVGCALTLAVFPFERKATGSMRWSWVGLAGVAVSAVLALLTKDPKLFFLRAVIGDAVWGLAMLGSLVIGRPLIATFASWVVKIPEEYKNTSAYKRSFGLLTLVWGLVNVARAAGRGYYMAAGTLDQVIVMQFLTGWPVFAALVGFSVWYPRRLAHRYLVSIGGDETMIDDILLGGLEEAHNVELISGAEE